MIPISLDADWNMISGTIVPLIDQNEALFVCAATENLKRLTISPRSHEDHEYPRVSVELWSKTGTRCGTLLGTRRNHQLIRRKGVSHEYAPPLPLELEELSRTLVDSALKIRQTLGPGLRESVCEVCLCVESGKRNIGCETQAPISIVYEGVRINAGLRLDLLIEKSVSLCLGPSS